MTERKIETISELQNAFELQAEIGDIHYDIGVARDTIEMAMEDLWQCLNTSEKLYGSSYCVDLMRKDYNIIFAQTVVITECRNRLKGIAPEECDRL